MITICSLRAAPRDQSCEGSQTEDVEIEDTECDSSHYTILYQQLSEHAAKWREIGAYLGFKKGEMDTIETTPSHYHGGPKSCLSAMLSEWLEWTPGDGRGSLLCATLKQLKFAVSKCGLGKTAQELHCITNQKESSV